MNSSVNSLQQGSSTTTTTTTVVFLRPSLEDNEVVEEAKQQEPQEQKKSRRRKRPARTVQWIEETIDNEHLGRLKSGVCCIYHKSKDAVDVSSDTCTSDDEGNELDRDRITKKKHKKICRKHKNCQGHEGNDGEDNPATQGGEHHHQHGQNHSHHGHQH